MAVPTDASADWDATTQLAPPSLGANPAFPAGVLPSSLVFRTRPDWWCDEACPFGTTDADAPGAGDGRAGAVCKLPAQILLESGTHRVRALSAAAHHGRAVRHVWVVPSSHEGSGAREGGGER